MQNNAARRRLGVLWIALVPMAALGHHSLLIYDNREVVDYEGEVVDFFWRNPHVRLTVRSIEDDGSERIWTAEGPPVNAMSRAGMDQALVSVGDVVTVVGHPSRNDVDEVRLVFLTASDGQHYSIDPDAVATFNLMPEDAQSLGADGQLVAIAAEDDDAEGIFRVWTNRDRHWLRDVPAWWAREFPLTDAAQRALDAWNRETDDLAAQCIPAGMPEAMMMPFPIEFIDNGDTLTLKIEEWDNARTIHLNADRDANVPYSRLGYSVGRWEGNTLVVETSRINYPFFNDQGIPQSDAVEIVERFTLSGNDTRLDWTATVTDPGTFTQPIDMAEMHWDWIPGHGIQPYNCVVDD